MVKEWELLYQNLLIGYECVNPISDDERTILPYMLIAIELIFVTYWNNNGNIEYRDDAVLLVEWLYNKFVNIVN